MTGFPLAQTIDALVHEAIAQRIFPGALVRVIRGSTTLHDAAYGSTMYADAGSLPVQRDTIYDIASLTKVFTATAVLRLHDQRVLDIYAPVAAYLPAFRSRDVALIHLLTHTSGLDLRLSVLREGGRAGLLEAAYAAQPIHTPGSVVAYTNINALLLGEIVAQQCRKPFDQALQDLVLDPLDLRTTRFCPPAAWLPRIAPTEHDAEWRKRLVHGTVHDESTHALGGVAGHAGLFSTVDDLQRFCAMWLRAIGGQPELISPAMARAAATNQTAALHVACGLGWMMDRANFMGHAPAGSFGHTGFTGPALVVVPAEQLTVIVLSNRVYPQRRPPPYQHHTVTAAIVDAARSFGA